MKKIILTKGFEAIVDADDYEMLSKFKWCSSESRGKNYANRGFQENLKFRKIKMHHQIMGKPQKGMVIDHINGNTLDNRKSNLRICTQSNNTMNKVKRKNCSSIYKGVSFSESEQKYRAYITVQKKTIHLGRHKDEVIAALTYNDAAKKYHGEFALLNKINFTEND